MIHVRLMTRCDLPLGMRLKEQAGWNQTEADWLRQLDLEPAGCFVAEWDGIARGTACTCVFGSVAWIATLLVDEPFRRRGIGTALLKHALEYLDRRAIRTVRLDATPLGQSLYERLGFVPQFPLARFEGVLPPSPAMDGVRSLRPEEAMDILGFDQRVTATERGKLLIRLVMERPETLRAVHQSGRLAGFLMSRPGACATQIGPCLAEPAAGALLLADAWHRYAGQRVYVDIPTQNTLAMAVAQAHGLTIQRQLLRMCRGPAVVEDVSRLWASFGPEKG